MPTVAEAFTLALQHHQAGRLLEAEALYRQVLQVQPDHPDALSNLGVALWAQGKQGEAIECFQRALTIKPDSAAAHNNLANALKEQGKLEEAAAHYLQVLAVDPASAGAYNNLGGVLQAFGKMDEAIAHYRQALVLDQGYAEAYCNLGHALAWQGKREEALACFKQALALKPSDGLRIIAATLLPVIYESKDHLIQARRSYEQQVSRLLEEDLALSDPSAEVGATNFFLAYQGRNDCELQMKVAKLYERACPSLLYTAAHCLPEGGQVGEDRSQIRVGFISSFFKRHPVGTCFNRVIEQLAKSGKLEVVLLAIGTSIDDYWANRSASCFAHVLVPRNMQIARQKIADLRLDILVYADIGMEPLTYFLAFARLAPVQCVLAGHPVTTGISNMDYFISSQLLEGDDADAHYSEKLVKFKSLSVVIPKPDLPVQPKSRIDLGLPVDRSLYVCPARLQKLHPDFDWAIAEILRRDPNGEVILFKDFSNGTWHGLMLSRFARSMPDVLDRVRFLPWAKGDDFMNILMLADVVLDPFHFGLGTTVFSVFTVGCPIVTLPPEFMRGRVTYSCYKLMGMMDCVASTKEEYVKLAVCLGTDPIYHKRIREKIRAKNHILYENMNTVREFERFFLKVCKAKACRIKPIR